MVAWTWVVSMATESQGLQRDGREPRGLGSGKAGRVGWSGWLPGIGWCSWLLAAEQARVLEGTEPYPQFFLGWSAVSSPTVGKHSLTQSETVRQQAPSAALQEGMNTLLQGCVQVLWPVQGCAVGLRV